jgi:hypothetical protein
MSAMATLCSLTPAPGEAHPRTQNDLGLDEFFDKPGDAALGDTIHIGTLEGVSLSAEVVASSIWEPDADYERLIAIDPEQHQLVILDRFEDGTFELHVDDDKRFNEILEQAAHQVPRTRRLDLCRAVLAAYATEGVA